MLDQTRSSRPPRTRTWTDPDLWHSAAVAAVACVLSGGVLYLIWLRRTWRIARAAPTQPRQARRLLLFGKRLSIEGIDAEFGERLNHLRGLLLDDVRREAWLLGGDSGNGNEALAAQAWLIDSDLPDAVKLHCEQQSIDTMENLRNARSLLGSASTEPVGLISSRYHLPRCLLLARHLGLNAEACAPPQPLTLSARMLARLALEAGYCLWIDTGIRWSRLIGNARMLARVS